MMNLRPALAALLLIGSATSHAMSVGSLPLTLTTEASVTPQTMVSSFVELAKFDASLGTLTSVLVELHETLTGTVKMENKATSAGTLGATVNASVSLGLPTGGALLAITSTSSSFAATAADGVVDFAGSSGKTSTFSASADSQSLFVAPADLALFTGTDVLRLSLDGQASSHVTGTGYMVSGVKKLVGGSVRITYTYELPIITTPTAAVPEPDTWALMAAGLGMVGMLAARRKKA